MKLTKQERLILYNQYRILEKLDPDDAEYYSKIQEALSYGYERECDSLVDNFFDTPKEICEEVYDILQMYSSLYLSYQDLEDKTGINERDVVFQGFDGNEEIEHYSYVQFVIKKDKRYIEFDKVNLNSHCNMLREYRRMLSVWKNFERYTDLTKEQIIQIIGK